MYSALTFVAMALYGVETWIARGEAFGVLVATPAIHADAVERLRERAMDLV